jgi:hypothetical protein
MHVYPHPLLLSCRENLQRREQIPHHKEGKSIQVLGHILGWQQLSLARQVARTIRIHCHEEQNQ